LHSLPGAVTVAADGILAVSLIVFIFYCLAAISRSQDSLTQVVCQTGQIGRMECKDFFRKWMQRTKTPLGGLRKFATWNFSKWNCEFSLFGNRLN
jgi:hypothetical protein